MALHPTAASGRWFLVSHCDCAFFLSHHRPLLQAVLMLLEDSVSKMQMHSYDSFELEDHRTPLQGVKFAAMKKQKQQSKQVYLGLKKQPDT